MEKHHGIHILKLKEWPTTEHQHAILWDMCSRSAQVSDDKNMYEHTLLEPQNCKECMPLLLPRPYI